MDNLQKINELVTLEWDESLHSARIKSYRKHSGLDSAMLDHNMRQLYDRTISYFRSCNKSTDSDFLEIIILFDPVVNGNGIKRCYNISNICETLSILFDDEYKYNKEIHSKKIELINFIVSIDTLDVDTIDSKFIELAKNQYIGGVLSKILYLEAQRINIMMDVNKII